MEVHTLKVYLAAPMRGGGNAILAKAVSKRITALGGEVLTPQVAADDWREAEAGLTDAQIFERDMSLLSSADALVAEVSHPSIGVGYEISEALKQKKPVLCLYTWKAKENVSALVLGNSNPLLKRQGYAEPENLDAILREWFESL